MAEWWVRFLNNRDRAYLADYTLMNPEVEVRNSEVGGFSGEIALGQFRRNQPTVGVGRDQFAPYRTQYEVWRQSVGTGVCITAGMLTSVNLNFNRDTILVSGKDWGHYLERRVYPFNPEHYVTFQDEFELHYWYRWPKKWYEPIGLPGDVPVKRIVRDLLTAMRTGLPVDYRNTMGYGANLPTANGVPPITWNIDVEGGEMAKYKIYPGDQTSIYDHIQALSEMTEKGFEWDITPLTLEFRLWMPRKWIHDAPVYTFRSTGVEGDGAIIEFDWTNEGPEGTYLYGYAAVDYKVGAHWTYQRSLDQHGRYDLVHDFGKIANYDVLLQKLKDQNDLWAQKKLSLAIYNPEFLAPTQPNFYTGDRPRSLIGNTIRVTHNFAPYHTVDAYFRINAIKWSVDPSSNETVTLELEMVYEPDTGNSGENA